MTEKKEGIQKVEEVKIKQKSTVIKEKLTQMFREEIDRAVQACRRELSESNKRILDKYQCDLEVTMTLTSQKMIPGINVIPRNLKQT